MLTLIIISLLIIFAVAMGAILSAGLHEYENERDLEAIEGFTKIEEKFKEKPAKKTVKKVAKKTVKKAAKKVK